MLVDRGLLDYDSPVADYWPEFTQNGKERVTVRHIMEHKAGIPIAPSPFTYDILKDSTKCGEILASSTPLWEPGTCHGYHAVAYGPLTNEILRRVDPQGRTMGQFFADEVAKPFGIDFFIGLPLEENYRAARLIIANASLLNLVKSLKSHRNRQVLRTSLMDTYLLKEMAINFGDLQDLLGILSAGGTDPVTGKKLLSREIADSFLDTEPESMDKVIKFPISWKQGMAIDYAEDGGKIFGHMGSGGQAAFADPRYQLGFTFISRYAAPFGYSNDPRYLTLRKAMYNCVKKMEG